MLQATWSCATRCGLSIAALMLSACNHAHLPPSPLKYSNNPADNIGLTHIRPAGDVLVPAVVLLHTCGGLGPNIFDWANRLRDAGYASVIVDSNRPRGVKNNCDAPLRVATDAMVADAAVARAYLKTLSHIDGERIGVLGFSLGGGAALRIASESYRGRPGMELGGFKAVAALYPPCGVPNPSPVVQANWDNLYDDVAAPTLLLLGDNDTETPASYCSGKADSLKKAGRPISYVVYAGATHGFDMPNVGTSGQTRPSGHIYRYDSQSTEQAWRDLKTFFDRELKNSR